MNGQASQLTDQAGAERSEADGPVFEPDLERQGRRLGAPGWWFLLVGIALAAPGAVLTALADSWAWVIGVTLLVLAGVPTVVAAGLLLSSLIARWSARHRSFA